MSFYNASFFLIFTLFFGGCASQPKNFEEYKTLVRKMDKDGAWYYKKKELNLTKASLADVELRMNKYLKKCLDINVTIEKTYTIGGNTVMGTGIYHPKVIKGKKEIALYLQRECTYGCGHRFDDVPEGGDWVSVSEVFEDKNGKLTGYTGVAITYGNLLEDTVGWLEGTSNLCTKLP